VWPEVRRRFPEWRLTIVGKDPGPSVLALRSLPGVEVTGTVPEVRPYYAEAVASIVPLRVGAGTRLKILEAMSAGVPVISTAIGAEGLDVTPGRDILIADGDEEWVAALDSLAQRPDLRNSLTQAARTLVEQRYDWDRIGERLCATYSRWLAEAK
jgi:polysaccharide biosynthesis protein PslH